MGFILTGLVLLGLALPACALPALEWRFPEFPLRTVFYVPAEAQSNLVLTIPRGPAVPVSRDSFMACGPDGEPLPLRVAFAGTTEVVLSLQPSTYGRRPCAVYYGSRASGTALRAPEAGIDPLPIEVTVTPVPGRAIPTSWDRLRYMLKTAGTKPGAPQRVATLDDLDEIVQDAETTRATKDKPARRRHSRGGRLVTISSLLICPRDGQYRFAVDCADAGFVKIDGELVATWPGEHPPKTWQVGAPVKLRGGVHRLDVFNLFGGSPKGLRVGWRPPGHKDIVPIAASDLAGACEAMETRVERMTRTLQPGFIATPVRAYSFRGDPNVFVAVQFKNLTENWIATAMESRWSFGDGTRSVEKNPEHVFTAAGVFKTTLEVRDALGFAAGCSDSVDTRQIQPEEYALAFDMTGLPAVSFNRDRLAPCLRVEGVGRTDLPIDVTWEITSRTGMTQRGRREIMPFGRELLVPLPAVSVDDVVSIHWQVRHRQVSLGDETIRFVHPPLDVRPAHIDGDRLYDVTGARLVLVPDENVALYHQTPLKLGRREGTVVCVDDMLAESGLTVSGVDTFDRILGRLLKGRVREVRYVAPPAWESSPQACGALRKLVDVPSLLRQNRADVAVLSVELRDLLDVQDAEVFERQAAALSDVIAGSLHIPMVWVTPPPYATVLDRCRLYAAAIRRVAEARAIPVVDLYTVLSCAADSRHAFFEDNPLVLSEVGHRLTGQHIARALVGE